MLFAAGAETFEKRLINTDYMWANIWIWTAARLLDYIKIHLLHIP